MKMLSSLKNNKSRDPHGFINELFKPGVGGLDLVKSILFMKLVNILCIYKGKGDEMN